MAERVLRLEDRGRSGVFRGIHDGTLSGPGGDVPPTGRRLEGHHSQFARFADGKSVESYLYYDQMEVATQLGLMPETADRAF